MKNQNIEVFGAREHNLKNIDVSIPRNKLTVITGLSGSGKSSLAFDTIHAEGQRRYIETFSAYARQYIGSMKRPNVDKITGLSPVIAIEQKTTSKNPRSTIGTTTELYDYFRLLYARASIAYSYVTREKMVKYTPEKIFRLITEKYDNKNIILLAPLVRGRKGHYKELFINLRKKGFLNVRIDNKITELKPNMQLDRYKTHDIEVVIDKMVVNKVNYTLLKSSLKLGMFHGKGTIAIIEKDKTKLTFFSSHLMCPSSGISYDEPAPHSFSFNSPRGACPKCKGLGIIHEIDIKKIIPDESISIYRGGIIPLGSYKNSLFFWQLEAIAKKYGFKLTTPIFKIPENALDIILNGSSESFRLENTPLGKTSAYHLSFDGVIKYISDREHYTTSKSSKKWAKQFINELICPECKGQRLKRESLHFFIYDKNISQLAEMSLDELSDWISKLDGHLSVKQKIISSEILKEIRSRLQFLLNVGLEYLTMNRQTLSLSGGEAQRIRLATQIGTQLVNVLYILDEPSIGLHQRDNKRLINSLKDLRDLGNSILVVEHDKEMIQSSDYLIDLGPFAGKHGGEVVVQNKIQNVNNYSSLTLQYLKNKKQIDVPKKRRKGNGKKLRLINCYGHNLKNIDVDIPLGKLICITGVSGSGKSTLINKTLHPILSQYFYRSIKDPLPYKKISGIEYIDKVVEVSQSPIGKTPRSNTATYTKIFDEIRKLFEKLPESKIRGYKAGRFSFNVKGGRCETCKGAGLKTIEMNFLPDVFVECDQCHGKRYNRETLEIRFKGKSINDVLNMTIEEALHFFEGIPHITSKLKVLDDVGLNYIHLGQPSTTLSGGESQRVKLAAELSKRSTGKTLYILDEPTTGLHFDDINVLLKVLGKLVDKGNTIIIIEHNMDVIKTADHIIDLGPEGGNKGGKIIFFGTPEELIKCKKSYTATFLKEEIKL